MIYVDSSVLIAALLAEDRRPAAEFWASALIASRLAMYEVYVRLQARRVSDAVLESASEILSGLAYVELTSAALERVKSPFPLPVRSLDALHLATALYVQEHDSSLVLATYDRRMAEAAGALGLELAAL